MILIQKYNNSKYKKKEKKRKLAKALNNQFFLFPFHFLKGLILPLIVKKFFLIRRFML